MNKSDKMKEDEEFYVCPQHQSTNGFESCCSCTGDRLCTEAIEMGIDRLNEDDE